MYVVRRWVAVAALFASTIAARDTRAETTLPILLAEGDREGLAADASVLRLAEDARPSDLYPAFAREGRYRSLALPVAAPPAAVTVRLRSELSGGTAIRLHLRTRAGTRWQPWEDVTHARRVGLSRPAQAIQIRAVLLGSSAASPIIREISVELEGVLIGARSLSAATTFRVYATREGLVGRRTANGHRIATRDRFVALPSWRVLNSRGERDYEVRVTYGERSVVLPIWDVGPWNTRDDYWSSTREMWQDLPRGMPQAQAAVQLGHNGGRDQFGRRPNLPNGIDIADGAFWDDLGLRSHAWVDVTFLWLEDASPLPTPTPGGSAAGTPPPLSADETDTTPPVAVMTKAVKVGPGRYFLRWYGKDESSGVDRYDVQVRHGADGKWAMLLGAEPTEEVLYKTSGSRPSPAFRVRAHDKAGNVGEFSTPMEPAVKR